MRYELYVITDPVLGCGRSHEEITRLAIDGGADVVQLRDKTSGTRDLLRAGRRMRRVTRAADVLFIVNDRVDVALACRADGVHLGQSDLPIDVARALAPSEFTIGVSVSHAAEAVQAVQEGADYVAASPVFLTASKHDTGAGCGIAGIKQIRKAVDVPIIAVGGIGLNNVHDVLRAGADGIAVISAVVSQPNITRAAQDLKNRIVEIKTGFTKQHRSW
ncbi:MAG: thiamine phosphate synthase [Halobacteriota archaeon]